MTTIGHFSKKDENYHGLIETRLWESSAVFRATTKTSDKAPDYRIFSGRCEIGAAWKKTTDAGVSYLSVTLDDPSFAAPINCHTRPCQHGEPDDFYLIWTRSKTEG